MYKIFLALRYLVRRRIALFAIGSVALCVVLMVIITSLFNGFLDLYDDYWQHEFGQAKIENASNSLDLRAACDFLESQPEVDYVRVSATSGGLLFLNNGNVKQVTIRGIDLGMECRAEHFKSGLLTQETSGRPFELSASQTATAEKWLADKLRKELNDSDRPAAVPCIMSVGVLGQPSSSTDEYDKIKISDEIKNWQRPAFIFTGSVDSSEGDTKLNRRNIRCWPIDAIETGSNHLDEGTVYMPYDYVCREFNTRADILIIGKKGISDEALADAIKRCWPGYIIDTLGLGYEELRKSQLVISRQQPWFERFTREINKQLATMQVILGFVCVVAAVLIFVILMMIVLQKRRDIGIVRASGGTRFSVTMLFMNYGLMIGICGTALGLLIGIWAVHNIEMLEGGLSAILGFKIWKAGSYGFTQIPNWVDIPSLWWITASGIITASLGAIIPACKAARSNPAQNLRFE